MLPHRAERPGGDALPQPRQESGGGTGDGGGVVRRRLQVPPEPVAVEQLQHRGLGVAQPEPYHQTYRYPGHTPACRLPPAARPYGRPRAALLPRADGEPLPDDDVRHLRAPRPARPHQDPQRSHGLHRQAVPGAARHRHLPHRARGELLCRTAECVAQVPLGHRQARHRPQRKQLHQPLHGVDTKKEAQRRAPVAHPDRRPDELQHAELLQPLLHQAPRPVAQRLPPQPAAAHQLVLPADIIQHQRKVTLNEPRYSPSQNTTLSGCCRIALG